ncbi:FmdE family protein [Hydrogenimonas thermophila]|uniref:FmdE, Molybdenum formylmethanofuran dehydrogenase operon n=1 Tax=Hydrogenimonas thermophila TaxID=223786 RepID=A0A1I5SZX9_9BACT|nr:FmdE family protein [Hydrogenimonas thermophila]SFP76330.1 FmdE, Molybdenum formylmethanofuran dehydrogenase operon [Hydrogenimonas thermophila]
MNYPAFFDEVEPIETIDPLADVLGAIDNGSITYNYIDMVKLAGHSCPTVAGAWLMCKIGLKELYKDELPVRGNVKVELKGSLDEGVTGVTGSCIGLVTGAANEGGFKGLNGKMARNNRLFYGVNMEKEVRLTRLDTNDSVELSYDPSIVPGSPEQQQLMQKIMQGNALPEDKKQFGELWQERVKKILLQSELWSQMVTLK